MGRGSSGGGEQIQRVIRELPDEAKPFLYGFGDKEIEDPETGEMIPNPDYVQGLLPRAQELFTGEMPEYQVAGFDPLQERAFNLADAGVGAYQPYLDAASDAQRQGIRATGQALDATQALAGQIPGQVGLGQQALGSAGRGVLAAAGRGEAAGTAAANRLQNLEGRGQGIATQASRKMDLASQLGRGFAESGISKADIASERARQSTAGAQQALMDAGRFGRGTAGRGIASLRGAANQFDPTSVNEFYNPFETQAIDAALADIERAGARQLDEVERQTRDQALRQGAFTGSRRFLEQFKREEPLREDILERQARTAAQMRQTGYEQAAQRAQSSFEDARRRQLQRASTVGQLGQLGAGTQISAAGQAGQLGLSAEQLAQRSALEGAGLGLRGEQQAGGFAQGAGQLGLAGLGQDVSTTQASGQMGMQAADMGMRGANQAGQLGAQAAGLGLQGIDTGLGAQQQVAGLGQGIGGLGMQMANLGGMQQGMGQSDINLLSQLGAQKQKFGQAELDAIRANQMAPYQQAGFFSDILQGAPIGTAQTSFSPGPSPFQQFTGAALTYGGLQNAGVFS